MTKNKFAIILFVVFALLKTSNAQQSQIVYLSGTDFENPVKWDFFCTGGNNSGKWGTINVPSQWELEGYGEYTYGRWYREGGLDNPSMEEGHYRYRFTVPANYKGKTIDLVFGGVMTDTEVKVNGKLAGPIHQGGFYQFSFPVSKLLKYGADNLLEVRVMKHSVDRLVNAAERKADWWLFGGIYRPVWLEVKPKMNIRHFAVDAKADGSFYADVHLEEIAAAAVLEISIEPLKGSENYRPFRFDVAKGSAIQAVQAKWEGVRTWSPEDPNLYNLTVKLMKGDVVVHQKSHRIGFRTLEFKKRDGIYVNGVRTVFKGINRHTFWPESGRSTSKRISLLDAQLIKDMNMNAVRSHYPPDTHFLDMCDSLGLFFIDELAGWQNAYNTEVGSKLVRLMVERDVNHPSVVVWANGNEGGWNYEVDNLFGKYDPQKRIVVHPWADFNGWDTHHYPAYQTGIHRFNDGENVFFPTETGHGMYDEGHGAGLEDFWNKWSESPLFAGAFLWAYNDDAVLRSDWTGEKKYDSFNYMAPDGIVGPYREKEGSYFTVKEVWAPVQFKERRINDSFDGSFLVTNGYLYTNLNRCKMEYRVVQINKTKAQGSLEKKIASGPIDVPSIIPGETRKIQFVLPDNFFEGDVLEITAWDMHGKEIYTWTWPIHLADYYAGKYLPAENVESRASFDQTDSMMNLKAQGLEIVFNRSNGQIVSIKNGDRSIPFDGGPVPVGMKARVYKSYAKMKGDDVQFVVNYAGGIDSITWLLKANGLLRMEMVALTNARNDGGFDGSFFDDQITNFGLTFNFPEEEVKGMQWFGRGPYRVWKNRIKGTTYGLWEKEYNNTITGESFENLIYPEFKGHHAHLFWARMNTEKQPITFFTESDGVFFHMLTPEQPKGRERNRRTQPPFPSGDISFLYEIGAMHCFKPLAHHGPKSQPASIRIKQGDEGIRMKLWFDFTDKY